MSRTLRHLAVPLFLLLCLLLGGSAQGVWRNLVLQLAAIALLGWTLLARRRTEPTPSGRWLLLFASLWFALLLLQLVPLPPSLWSALPGREVVAQSFVLRGQDLPWLPLSLVPAATAATLPMIAVPLAIIAAMLWLGAYRSRWCIAALVAGTFLSVLLGALQLAQGGPYLYPVYNLGNATGLFANSNHQGTLLLATIPFLAAAIGREMERGRSRSTKGTSRILIAAGALAVVLAGVLLNRSLAALLLVLPVCLASAAVAIPRLGRGGAALAGPALLLLLAGVAVIAWQSGAGSSDTSLVSRADIYQRTVAAIGDTFPVGTGVGSFDAYYRLYEDPAEVGATFVNHAHSDPLEWLLETGLAGALLLCAFLLWWVSQCVRVWRAVPRDPAALAGTIASAAILAHSLVDYPLRDAAIQAVFALCLAFMVDPRSHSAVRRHEGNGRSPRHLGIEDDDAAVSG